MALVTPLILVDRVSVRVSLVILIWTKLVYYFSSHDICDCVGVLFAVRRKQQNGHSCGRRRRRWFLQFGYPRPRHTQVLINRKNQQSKRKYSSGICIQYRLAKVVRFLFENNYYHIFLTKKSIKINFSSSPKCCSFSSHPRPRFYSQPF